MAVPPNPFSSALILRIPLVSQVTTDPIIKAEHDMIFNALRQIQQAISDTTPP